jgi:hypothetical protein
MSHSEGMSPLERLRYHLEQWYPETVDAAHLKACLVAIRDHLEAQEKREKLAAFQNVGLI